MSVNEEEVSQEPTAAIEARISAVQEAISAAEEAMRDLQRRLEEQQNRLREAFQESLKKFRSVPVDMEELDSFMEEFVRRPFWVVEVGEGEWLLGIPKIFSVGYGWFIRQDGVYNIFRVNRYYDMIQPVPDFLRDELDLQRPFGQLFVDGGQLIIADPTRDDPAEVQARYRKYLTDRPKIDEQTLRVHPDKEFDLIAAIIRDGILPFVPHPVDPEDRIDRHGKFKLRDYQRRDLAQFFKYGAVGIFYFMGLGKTYVALEAMCQLRGPKLVLVPERGLKEQWEERIRTLTDLTPDEYEVVVYHRSHVERLRERQWTLVVYDEMHRLPAKTFLPLATLQTKYRINLTGTPWREDGRIDLIWALSGMPLGVDWGYFLERDLIRVPEVVVYIERDMDAKYARLRELLRDNRKTIIYTDRVVGVYGGKDLSQRLNIPLVYGDTPPSERIRTLREERQVVVSRVGDLGISLPDLEVTIEFDFLGSSRAQEMQRYGRHTHSEHTDGQHIVLMTVDEWHKFSTRLAEFRRLHGVRIRRVRGAGVTPEMVYSPHTSISGGSGDRRRTGRKKNMRPTATASIGAGPKSPEMPHTRPPPASERMTSPIPVAELLRPRSLFSRARRAARLTPPELPRDVKLDRQLLLRLLDSDYARILDGLTVGEIHRVLTQAGVIHTYQRLRGLLRGLVERGDVATVPHGKGKTLRYYSPIESGDSKELILRILSAPEVQRRGGLSVGEVIRVLQGLHVSVKYQAVRDRLRTLSQQGRVTRTMRRNRWYYMVAPS